MRYALEILYAGSLSLTHSCTGHVPGLDSVPEDERPPLAIVFWSFRIMLAMGVLMAALGLWSGYERWRGRLHESRWLHRAAIVMGPAGFIAVIAGWITTEVGRQPFVVFGHLRTAEGVSPIDAPAVEASLIAFIIVYFIIFGIGTWFILRLMHRPPDAGDGLDQLGITRSAGITPAPSVRRQHRTAGE